MISNYIEKGNFRFSYCIYHRCKVTGLFIDVTDNVSTDYSIGRNPLIISCQQFFYIFWSLLYLWHFFIEIDLWVSPYHQNVLFVVSRWWCQFKINMHFFWRLSRYFLKERRNFTFHRNIIAIRKGDVNVFCIRGTWYGISSLVIRKDNLCTICNRYISNSLTSGQYFPIIDHGSSDCLHTETGKTPL